MAEATVPRCFREPIYRSRTIITAVRRALWIATDNTYKSAAELFEHKKAALEQQTAVGEKVHLDDFSRASVVTYTEPPPYA